MWFPKNLQENQAPWQPPLLVSYLNKNQISGVINPEKKASQSMKAPPRTKCYTLRLINARGKSWFLL